MKLFRAASSSLIALAFAAGSADAQITTFSTRPAFTGAAGSLTIETFNACGTQTVSLATNFVLSSGNLGPCSSLQPGVTYAPPTGGGLYIAAPGQSANLSTALGMNTPSGGWHTLTFAAAIRAFGADLFQNNRGGDNSFPLVPFEVEAFGGSGSLGLFDIAFGTGGFFGFVSNQDVLSVQVRQTNGFAVMDNVSWSSGVAVPEPATWPLLVPAIMGFAVARRRRIS